MRRGAASGGWAPRRSTRRRDTAARGRRPGLMPLAPMLAIRKIRKEAKTSEHVHTPGPILGRSTALGRWQARVVAALDPVRPAQLGTVPLPQNEPRRSVDFDLGVSVLLRGFRSPQEGLLVQWPPHLLSVASHHGLRRYRLPKPPKQTRPESFYERPVRPHVGSPFREWVRVGQEHEVVSSTQSDTGLVSRECRSVDARNGLTTTCREDLRRIVRKPTPPVQSLTVLIG